VGWYIYSSLTIHVPYNGKSLRNLLSKIVFLTFLDGLKTRALMRGHQYHCINLIDATEAPCYFSREQKTLLNDVLKFMEF
jgi:hypothetical protein